MKRAGKLIKAIANLNNLYLAFWKAQRGKRQKEAVVVYRQNLQQHLQSLQRELLNNQLQIGNYHYFTIYDPKERIICAASFPERVLHHALMNICHPIFENFQIYDSYATRVGKGTYAALNRASAFHRHHLWFLKLDVRKYFDSIGHPILLNLLQQKFKDGALLSIFEQIISTYQTAPNKGLPIGNLTSQYFANYYLAFLDRYIKETLKIKGYVRYMDDMVLWSNNKEKLLASQQKITSFLEQNLQLQLKTSYLNRTTHGLNFLGYRLYPHYRKLSLRSKRRFQQKMKQYHYNLAQGFWTQQQYKDHVTPLIAFTQHAVSKGFRRSVLAQLNTSIISGE